LVHFVQRLLKIAGCSLYNNLDIVTYPISLPVPTNVTNGCVLNQEIRSI